MQRFLPRNHQETLPSSRAQFSVFFQIISRERVGEEISGMFKGASRLPRPSLLPNVLFCAPEEHLQMT